MDGNSKQSVNCSVKSKKILPLFSAPASRKRQKKERDRAWEFEDRDRRSSGEHRRGNFDARRGSGSRYDESDEDSPPPSLSDG